MDMEKFKILNKTKIEKLPKTTGVYLFYDELKPNTKHLTPIYIGKAINIKDRVKNHFQQPNYRDNLFINKITEIGFLETGSEIEALILEANLIKKYQPKFNVVWRDDKNYFYVAIAKNKNKIPYIFITHQPKLQTTHYKLQTNYIGPFVEGIALKKTLRFLRKIFPYYTSKKHPKQKCTWCHLDLCPGPLLFENPLSPKALTGLREYKKNIKKLVLILKGETTASGGASLTAGKTVLNSLKKEMSRYARSGVARKNSSYKEDFEKAVKTRDQIYALEQIMANTNIVSNNYDSPIIDGRRLLENRYNWHTGNASHSDASWDNTQKILQKILKIKKPIERIECYDISNLQGKYATGSMIVFKNGKPDKSQYKKFRIKMEDEPNDIAMLKEILERRFLHPEWPLPEIILIDGGIAQLNVAINVKNSYASYLDGRLNMKHSYSQDIARIKVISIAKGKQELFIAASPQRANESRLNFNIKFGQKGQPKKIPLKALPQNIYNLIVYLDDEAHRFAITYHKKLRKKALLT